MDVIAASALRIVIIRSRGLIGRVVVITVGRLFAIGVSLAGGDIVSWCIWFQFGGSLLKRRQTYTKIPHCLLSVRVLRNELTRYAFLEL